MICRGYVDPEYSHVPHSERARGSHHVAPRPLFYDAPEDFAASVAKAAEISNVG